jgi:hypothetical protein
VQLGLRWYFTRPLRRRYVLHATGRTTALLSDERNAEYRALTAGLSFFF